MTSRQQRRLISVAFLAVVIGLLLYRQYQQSQRPAFGPQIHNNITCGVHCGTERWLVKTLSDADVASINFSPQPTTVTWLASQPAPSPLPADSRLAPLEIQAFTVRAQLIAIKEESDRDFHLILADPANPSTTMLAEIPSSECSGACSSQYASSFESARTALESRFGMPPTTAFQNIPGTVIVDVTGIAFFDFFHSQRGVAPNAIELHPVLTIHFE